MLIDKLLSGAVRLWLKSQTSAIDDLEIKIASKDRQIIQGVIPQISINTSHAIYQDLHLSEVKITGTNIKVNLPQIIKRKPLKLLEPIIIDIQLLLRETDLQNSLNSRLLAIGLTDLWQRFLVAQEVKPILNYDDYRWSHIALSDTGITLQGNFCDQKSDYPIEFTTNIKLDNPHSLLLSPQKISAIPELPTITNKSFLIDLGTQVSITQLALTSDYLLLHGTVTVFP